MKPSTLVATSAVNLVGHHIESVCHKATNTLSFLRLNIHQCPAHLKEQAYISLVHSMLGYAAAVWEPYKKGDITKLEKVQQSAA